MQCHEARHLLNLGVLPGAADPARTMLGFHLSSCSTCRDYRTELHNQRLLQMLVTQTSSEPHVPATARHAVLSNSATNSLRVASLALLVGGALALSPLTNEATAHAGVASSAAKTTYVSHRAANESRIAQRTSNDAPRARLAVARQHRVARAAANASASTSTAPAAKVAASASATTAAEMQSAPLQEGMELIIPALPQSPEEIAAAPAGQVAPLALYVVRAGDNLTAIAMQFYGNANLWQTIYLANQAVIGGNPSLIFPGQVLTVPAKPPVTPAQPGSGQQANVPSGIHIVQSGETLSGIAQAAYGDSGQWSTIYNANVNLIGWNYNLIFPGQRLTIPAAQTGRGATAVTQPVINTQVGGYVVQSGDSLWAIAQNTYGNGNLWNVIYEANKGVIGGNPSLIYPGQQFAIPTVS